MVPHATAANPDCVRAGILALTGVGALAVAAVGTRFLIGAAHSRGVLDIPNQRSSHSRPTPRGGGAAIVAVVLLAEVYAVLAGLLDRPTAVALALGGALVAAVGAWDDVHSLSARARLLVHFASAAIAVSAIANVGGISIGDARVPLTLVPGVICVLGTVWMTNLYNFMDGIDGIAGAEAVVSAVVACLIFFWSGQPGLAIAAVAVAGGAAGFLVFNWPPARIFMGDVGSGFLGFTFAVLALSGDRAGGASSIWILLPLLPFVVDSTVTLARRALSGQAIASAHREHLYQRLTQAGRSHAYVARIFSGSAVVLGAVSLVGSWHPEYALSLLAGSFALSFVAYLVLLRGAGAPRPASI